MANFFGGKDPFDHPFFTQPFGGFFGGKNPFNDAFFTRPFDTGSNSEKQITIEELNPNDDDDGGYNAWKNDVPGKELSVNISNEFPTGVNTFSFQRVAYGGADGIYYTSSVGRRTGGDGVFLMEMKEEDRTVGESLHTISKGIHDKGHSVTAKKSSDGRVDSLQTLHNLEEDELAGFEEKWKSNADKVLPGWNDGFNLLENTGSNDASLWNGFANWWPFPALEYTNGSGDEAHQPSDQSEEASSRKTSRRFVPIE